MGYDALKDEHPDWPRYGPEDSWPCAWIVDPATDRSCGQPGMFYVTQVGITRGLPACLDHLGHLLAHANTIEFPFTRFTSIDWIDPTSDHPPGPLTWEQADERIRELRSNQDPNN